jgi:hypothetical protein
VISLRSVILTVSTPTYAIKAKRILRNIGINTETVKVDSGKDGSGCTHGIRFDEGYLYDVIAVLREKNIQYKVYSEK